MGKESRTHKSLINAKVNLVFYLLTLFTTFFSRKIFLDYLGADFVGLTGTLQNILGLLNLAELGVGAAVSFALYQPIAHGQREEINRIVSLLGCIYRYIGLFVLGAAVLVSLFLPLIFRQTVFSQGLVYFAFWSFLTSSLIGYFVNYRQILLTADQKNYIIISRLQTTNIVKALVQMALVWQLANLYLWVAIELVFGLLYAVILNRKIRLEYPWLSATARQGQPLLNQYSDITRRTRQVFVHKLKDFLLSQSDQILVFAFVSLKMVAYYGNYAMVVSRLTLLFNTMMDGITAGVGNLIAEGDKGKIYKVFWEMVFVRYTIAGIVVFALYHGIQPFICLWLGKEYLLSHTILLLLMVNTFIMLSRGAVDIFNAAYGNYHDTWSAWAEGAINITVTIITCFIWGLPGVLLGKLASILPIIVIWKPLFLYRTSFHQSMWQYWKNIVLTLLGFIIAFTLASRCAPYLPLNPYKDFGQWTGYCIILTLIFVLLYMASLLLLTPGARLMAQRVLKSHSFRHS